MQGRHNSGERVLTSSLLISGMKTVAIHELLEQLRVDDEVTTVHWRRKIQRFRWFYGPGAV